MRRSSLASLAALLAAAGWAQAQAPARTTGAPAATRFETYRLANGVRVWYHHVPDDPRLSMAVVVPAGSDDDPPGKEELAHFLEHVQFGDRGGLTEEQLNREVDVRGGSADAHTYADRTEYLLTIGAEHAPFAARWLARLVSPVELTPAMVARQRAPIALEAGAQSRSLLARVGTAYLHPPLLSRPSEWERHFGVPGEGDRDYDPARTLASITPADLREFYDRHYVPSRLTVIVAGGGPRDATLAAVREAFAALPARAAAAAAVPATRAPRAAPGFRVETTWKPHSYALYRTSFGLVDVTADDRLWLGWLRELLAKRLDDQLRYGDRKAVYHPDVTLELRGTHALLTVAAMTSERDLPFVRGVVEREISRLRDGSVPPGEFTSDRDAVAFRLRSALSTAGAMDELARSRFAAAPPFDAPYPDVEAVVGGMTPARLAALMRPRFVRDRQVVRVSHASPIATPLLLVAACGIAAAVLRHARRRLVRPLDMRRLRYIARFRVPIPYAIAAGAAAGVLAALLVRVAVYAAQRIAADVLWRVDSAAVQWGAYAAAVALAVWAAILALALVPRKLLVFDDAVAIKHLAYRSTVVPADAVAELALLSARDVWRRPRLARCVALAAGVRRPGIYLRRADGCAWYFRTRDTAEAFDVLTAWARDGGRVRLSRTPGAVPGVERGEIGARSAQHRKA